MPLYTFLADYRGGTYVAQLRAGTPLSATRAWAKKFDYGVVWGMGKAGKEQLVEEMLDEINAPVPLKGLKHVWCCSALVRGKLMLVNIIQTEE